MNTLRLQRIVFLLLLAGITLAFLWVLTPFAGAVLWAMTLAMLFNPLYQRLRRRLNGRANLAALLVLGLCLVIVIIPLIVIGANLAQEVTNFTQRVRSGTFDFRSYYQHVLAAVPHWVLDWLDRVGIGNLESLLNKLYAGLTQAGQRLAASALELGQNTLQFVVVFGVMLYLLFFFLRDGVSLARMVRGAVPMSRAHTAYLMAKFSTVVRATVKGNILVAVVQGVLGGLAFWALDIGGAVFWGAIMAFLSLLPAVGAALVWGPVAIYLFSTGAIGHGALLTFWGVVVIGMSDNVLRPILVGKETRMPDYLVLISTLGGMSLMGINGFVIGPTIAAMFIASWALFQRGSTPRRRGQTAQVALPAVTAAAEASALTDPSAPPPATSATEDR
jgi:predicted PurR-regulated permease PerM